MRRLLAPAVLLVAMLLPAELAGACSCVQLDPPSKLKAAKAAFVGRVVDKKLVGGSQEELDAVFRYRIRVGRALKRPLGRRIKLRQRTQSAACGFEWDRGELVAAYLYGRRGRWSTSSCSLERPRVMRRLARERARESVSRRPRRSPRSTCR